jgi:NADH dehydrogenase (ubiquinone) Fe-S protein 5
MSSGWGVHGGVGRCYPLFSQFTHCMARALHPRDCGDEVLDYLDCLHGTPDSTQHARLQAWAAKVRSDPAASARDRERAAAAEGPAFLSVAARQRFDAGAARWFDGAAENAARDMKRRVAATLAESRPVAPPNATPEQLAKIHSAQLKYDAWAQAKREGWESTVDGWYERDAGGAAETPGH